MSEPIDRVTLGGMIAYGDGVGERPDWTPPVDCDCGNAAQISVDINLWRAGRLVLGQAICRLCGADIMPKVRALLDASGSAGRVAP